MKKILLLVAFVSTVILTSAQTKTLNEITSFKFQNSGVITDENMDVNGYYYFYKVDKLKGGNREYAINIIDQNLNEVATKSYIDSKNAFLMEGKFNNQSLLFAMANYKAKNIKLISFDRKANEQDRIEVPVTKKEMRWLAMMERSGSFNLLFPVDNKGFLFNYVVHNAKAGYSLKYVPTDGGKAWEFNSDVNSKQLLTLNPIAANKKVVVALQMSKKSLMSQSMDMKVFVLDINTGKVLFEKEYGKKENPRLVTNAFITENDEIVVLGEYFEPGDNIIKDKSLGLFADGSDLSGNTLFDSKVGWEEKIDALMPEEANGKNAKRGYVYFHEIKKTKAGDYYAVGERYRKTASAGGIAMAALGGGGSVTQLTITDAVVFKFDNKFNLQNIQVFEKGKSRAPSITDFGSPQLNAHALKAFGAFDYVFSQTDVKRDRLYMNFIDYERLKGEKNKFALKTIIYDDGSLSEDKIYLNEGKRVSRVMPGKLGSVLLMDYNKRKKTLDIHLEKINLE